MALRDWLGDSNGVATATVATTATVDLQIRGSVAKVATVSVATTPKLAVENPGARIRREKVLARLQADVSLNRVVDVDSSADPDNVIVTVAIRNVAVCEYAIPRAKYDPWRFLELFETHGGHTVN